MLKVRRYSTVCRTYIPHFRNSVTFCRGYTGNTCLKVRLKGRLSRFLWETSRFRWTSLSVNPFASEADVSVHFARPLSRDLLNRDFSLKDVSNERNHRASFFFFHLFCYPLDVNPQKKEGGSKCDTGVFIKSP